LLLDASRSELSRETGDFCPLPLLGSLESGVSTLLKKQIARTGSAFLIARSFRTDFWGIIPLIRSQE